MIMCHSKQNRQCVLIISKNNFKICCYLCVSFDIFLLCVCVFLFVLFYDYYYCLIIFELVRICWIFWNFFGFESFCFIQSVFCFF